MLLHETQGLDALFVACITFFLPILFILAFLRKEKNFKGTDEDHH